MPSNIDVSEQPARGGIKTRIFAFATIIGVVSGVGCLGREGYRAVTDSFVAPIILSPDNDVIIQNKIKLSELEDERAKTEAELEGIDAVLVACSQGIERLTTLQKRAENALGWTRQINLAQAYAGAADLRALSEQRSVLVAERAKQDGFAREARTNMGSGLISRSDYAREAQAASQIQIALIENERTRLQAEMQMKQVALGQRALAAGGGQAPMPEVIAHEDQVVRVELELLKLQAEQRTKLAERSVVKERLAKIDEVSAQLKGRPIFRAVEGSMDVAFVPYTQIEGMNAGASVYDCVWGLFRCRRVGTVAEIVAGEVILPDPWGTQTRGQYAVLSLSEHASAKSRSLRVRHDAPPGRSEPGSAPMAAK